MTTVAGSVFLFDFIGMQTNYCCFSHTALSLRLLGVSLSWYGFIPVELPFTPSQATYSIDGETPITFLLKGLPVNSTTTVYNQKFFETAQLSPTSHTLKVVYEGTNSTPLTLDYLIIQNGTSSSTTTSTTSLPTSTGSTTSATSTPKSVPVGSIVGGVIGGLALIIFAILGFFLLRRRQKRDVQEEVSTSTPQPFEYTPLHLSSPTPNTSSSGGFAYSQVPQTAQLGSRVTYGVKGQVHHGSMPSVTNTDSIEPPSTSSAPTNLRAVPFQQAALNLANPSPSSSSSSSPPASTTSSSARPVPLARKVEREVEALATLSPQRRGVPSVPASVESNDTWLSNANVVLHADSGIRMPSDTTSTSVVDVPPLYTPD